MTVPRPPGGVSLDAQAAAYARLLSDPCGAKLSHPIYAGGEGGYLIRVENDQVINNGATDLGAMGYWCPGSMSTTSIPTGISSGPVVNDTALQPLSSAVLNSPGRVFFQSNASAVRCVSACIQLSFPGTELNRSGFVALGQGTFGGLASSSHSTSTLRTMAERVRRMPDGQVEIRLVPNLESATYSSVLGAADSQGLPALFFSVWGIPPSTGVRVRMVAVYEWLPQRSAGLTLPSSLTTSESRNTLNDVLRAMKGWGDWAYEGFHEAANAVSSVIGAARAGQGLVRGTLRAGSLLMG